MGVTYVDTNGNADTLYHFGDDGSIQVERRTDLAPLFSANADMMAHGNGYSQSKDTRFVARIDPVVWEELKRSGIADDPAHLKKWLNDLDNRKFRTSGGRV